jgi:cysteine-rich repeat protein
MAGWARALLLVAALAATDHARAASSRDYPGPCFGERNADGVPLYLSADYHGANPVFGVVLLSETGRFRLGVSCVGTGFAVVRVGPDSALCTVRGLCTPTELLALNEQHIEAVRGIPNQVPFFQICRKHGFGWYDATGVPAGIYLAVAQSGSRYWGLVDGHGTMDTYAFVGNGGAFQPVNCARPPVCGNWIVEAGESCDDGNTANGDCCSSSCTVDPTGSGCPGNGDLCTPGLCNGSGFCLHENQCVDEPVEGVKLRLERRNGREKLFWSARNREGAPSGATADPSLTGAVLELYSPLEAPVAMALPAEGWTVDGNGSFRFRSRSDTSPIRLALVLRGRSLKVMGRSAGFSLATPLMGVGIRLVAGTLATCSFFPASSVVTSEPDRFEARGPGAFSETCDRFTLAGGVPGGEPNPGLPPDDSEDPGGGFCSGQEICPILIAQ